MVFYPFFDQRGRFRIWSGNLVELSLSLKKSFMIPILFIILVHNVWAIQMLLSEARHLVKVVSYTPKQRLEIAEGIVDIVQAVLLILIR